MSKVCCNHLIAEIDIYKLIYLLDTPSIDSSSKFWLSGVDVGCASNYVWCSDNVELKTTENIWAKDEPLAKRADNSNCVAVTLNATHHDISVEPCDIELGAICE
jgi:hypothetical protein